MLRRLSIMDNTVGNIKARNYGLSPTTHSVESESRSTAKKLNKYNEDISSIMKGKIKNLKSKRGSSKHDQAKDILNSALKRAS